MADASAIRSDAIVWAVGTLTVGTLSCCRARRMGVRVQAAARVTQQRSTGPGAIAPVSSQVAGAVCVGWSLPIRRSSSAIRSASWASTGRSVHAHQQDRTDGRRVRARQRYIARLSRRPQGRQSTFRWFRGSSFGRRSRCQRIAERVAFEQTLAPLSTSDFDEEVCVMAVSSTAPPVPVVRRFAESRNRDVDFAGGNGSDGPCVYPRVTVGDTRLILESLSRLGKEIL